MPTPSRQPAGTPTGGQFAAAHRDAPTDVTLDDGDDPTPRHRCGRCLDDVWIEEGENLCAMCVAEDEAEAR